MTFLDSIFGSALKKHTRRVSTRDAQPEDREASARWLVENGTDEALRAVFGRFELQLEHSLKDKKEKEYVFDLLVEAGAPAAAAARAFARTSVHFQWAVAVIDRIEGAGAGTGALLDLLAAQRLEDEFKPEKKRTLLLFLAERKAPGIAEAATRFLPDFDEGVRHAAIEAVAAQGGDGAVLAPALLNPKEESTRIRGRLAELFANNAWSLPEDAWLAANVPVGFRLSEGKLVARDAR